MIAEIVISAMMIATPVMDVADVPQYEDLGTMRITTYCENCNEPQGRQTSTGEEPHTGTCAGPSWLVGSTIYIDGEEFQVNDICGIENTIDIWVEGECGEDCLEYKKVTIKKEKKTWK